ncbi:hypothetical protein D7B24_003414 [Verticillium nonalfalfae]|uniref:MARVEL domain-containing protein n=1 Tax=Verticillium nonalfalfae TaxID=1051616 RepID=A0A3M9Y015_9PEZI|nr:uncharacterized protein D7B24_003414 [Verticillium nonalfalfae]RNJ52480.1 hypothetical protein D7B24_003414 [Verticillium nonalfalfae]
MSSDNLKGLNTRTHPHVPSWFFIVQLVVLALGLGVFIASAYSLSFFDGYGYAGAYSGSPGFLLFAALLIFIVVGSHIVLERLFSQWYFRLAFVIGYALTIIFLLSAWAWAASIARLFNGDVCDAFGCYSNDGNGYGSAMAAGAALGAFAWVLLIVLLVFYILASLKEGRGEVAPAATAADAEMGHVNKEAHQPSVAAPTEQLPQQQYQEQQPYQQQPYAPQDQTQQYAPQEQYPPQQQQQQQQH